LTVTGFIFLSLIEYLVFAPISWFLLFRNLSRQTTEPSLTDKPPVLTSR